MWPIPSNNKMLYIILFIVNNNFSFSNPTRITLLIFPFISHSHSQYIKKEAPLLLQFNPGSTLIIDNLNCTYVYY